MPREIKRSEILGRVAVYTFLSVCALVYIVPFYWMLVSSVKPQSELFKWPPSIFPKTWTLENYQRVFEVIPLARAYWNTFYTAVIIVLAQLFSCSLAGYAFEKLRFPLREFIFSAILFTLIIPFQSEMVPLYLLMSSFGLVNKHLAVIFPGLLTAFAIFFFRQNIRSIPDDLLDSAKLDGCGILGRFRRIVMPLIKPAIGTIMIFTFMAAWNNFLWPIIIINQKSKMLLEQALSVLTQELGSEEEGARMAGSTLAVLPILTVFFFAQKYFVRGIALTGLK